MSLKYTSLLKITVAGAVLLSVGACKPADKGQGALKSEGVAALNLSKSEASVFAKHFQTKACEVDEMEALGALAGLGLGESGSNNMTFSARDFNGGLVTYRDLVFEEQGITNFRAKTAVFHCPGMGEETPGYARLDLTDALIRDEDLQLQFATLNINTPSEIGASAIIDVMSGTRSFDDSKIGFDAVSMTDVTMTSDEMSGSLDLLAWGEERDETGLGKADLTMELLDLTLRGQNGAQDMTIDFKGMSARSLSIAAKLDAAQAMSANGVMESVVGNLNAFEKPYDELMVGTMDLDSEGFEFNFGGIEGVTTEKDGKIVTRQTLKPSAMSVKPASSDVPSFNRSYDIIKSLGFETVKFSGSNVTTLDSADDSIAVSDGLLVVDDAFKLNFEYSAEGLKEMATKMQAMMEADGTPGVMAAYDPLKLRNFRLTLEDNSIVERGLKLATEMTGESEKKIKLGLNMAVFAVAMAAENEVQAEVYSETVEAFAKFVNKGGMLTIEANPPAPFALSPLISGQGDDIDPATLGFSASQSGGVE